MATTAFGKIQPPFSDTVSQTVDVGSAADTVAYVWIGSFGTGHTPVSVTVGTDTLSSSQAEFNDGAWRWRLYYGELTVTGSQTVTATVSSNLDNCIMVGIIVPGVDTAGALLSSYAAEWSFDSAFDSASITSSTGDLVYSLLILDSTGSFTASGTTTKLSGTTIGDGTTLFVLEAPGASSVVVEGDFAATESYRAATFSVPMLSGSTNYTITAEQGSYSLSGQDVTLTYAPVGTTNYTLTAEYGTYTITGSDSYSATSFNCEYGTYAISGQDVTLTFAQGSQNYTLTAEHGLYTLTGRAAQLSWSEEVFSSGNKNTLSLSLKIGF